MYDIYFWIDPVNYKISKEELRHPENEYEVKKQLQWRDPIFLFGRFMNSWGVHGSSLAPGIASLNIGSNFLTRPAQS